MNCWIFDIDGVLTDPQQKKVVNHELWDQFTSWLQNNNPLTFNTGRSLEWIKQKILKPFESHLVKQQLPKSLLHNLMVVGEKGADWLNFDQDGNPHQTIDEKISVPQQLIDQVKKLTEKKFSNTMFFDTTKKTMISIEMKHNEDLDKFHAEQRQLVEELKTLIIYPHLTIDATIIATDIQNQHTGKALGTQRIVNWIKQRKFQIDHFYTFGDSKSDLDMAQKVYEIFGETKSLTFIYVGTNLYWDKKDFPFQIIHYPGFNHGTINFLSTTK